MTRSRQLIAAPSGIIRLLATATALGVALLGGMCSAQWYPAPPIETSWYPAPMVMDACPSGGPVLPAPQAVYSVRPAASNLRLEVTESFLNRIVSRQNQQAGPVRDFVLGADVYGNQNTTTETRLDLLPSPTTAKLTYTLSGQICNHTVGVTPRASVQSDGRHQMRIVKEIEFDGETISTRSPAAYITPEIHHVAAYTPSSGVPVVGPIISNIALQAAHARRPQAEAVAAQRVTEQAAPIFNTRIDAELSRLNILLRDRVRPQASSLHLLPDQQFVQTTDDTFVWSINVGAPPSIQAGTQTTAPGQAITIRAHESLIAAVVNRQSLGGIEIPDTAIDRWLRQGSLTPTITNEPSRPDLASIILAPVDPVRVRFQNDRAELMLRVGLRPVTGPELPIQEITIPFTFELTQTSIVVRAGEVSVVPADPAGVGNPLEEVARQLLRTELERRFGEYSFPRDWPLDLGETTVMLHVREITQRDGWATIAID